MLNKFSTCNVKLEFEFGRIEARHMNLAVLHNERSYLLEPTFTEDVGYATLTLEIELPTRIQFAVSNKGFNDTIVDSNGAIIKDCYIKLVSVSLDLFEINRDVLSQRVILHTETGENVKSNYFGFNGIAVLELLKPDVFSQVLTLNCHTD